MLDRNQLKNTGARYARSLQLLFKTASVFSGTHSAINVPLQNSFDQLNNLVKSFRQFTVGFVDNRVMLNNILTTDKTLQPLESEFLKRGIGAITFDAGITMAAYKRAILALSVQAKDIEAHGGISNYLLQNPLEFVRVFPASKTQQRNDSGDTILEMDSESFLMAKAMNEIRNPTLDRVDMFLQQAGLPGEGQGEGDGSGGGFAGPGGPGGPGGQGGPGGPGGPGAAGDGLGGLGHGGGTGHGGPEGSGFGLGGSVGGHGIGGPGGANPAGGPTVPAPSPVVSAGGPAGISSIVENYFSSCVMDSEDAPQRSYMELARIIQDTRPEFVLQNFTPQRREELRKLPPDQMAAEVIEDTAVKWAMERLATSPSGNDAVIVEEEVIRVLLRSLQQTQMAGRLARKLAEYVKEFQIPQSSYARIKEELDWVVIPSKEKFARLMKIDHYNRFEFRRLTGFLTDMVKAGERTQLTELASHYFEILDRDEVPEPEELGRVPELTKVIAGLRSEFWSGTAVRLCDVAVRWGDKAFLHNQVLNAILAICRNLAIYEDFELIENIGNTLERSAYERPEHQQCCGKALTSLLTVHALDRVVELYIQRRDDHNFGRTASVLLRRTGAPGITKAFTQLEDESVAAIRLSLLRLIGRIGAPALVLARERLNDPRWYVVRNSCKLLGDLKDPELLDHVMVALKHTDERVQKAAVTAVLDSRHARRAEILSEALPFLHPHVMEDVFGELMFMRDPKCLPMLANLLFKESRGVKTLVTCVQTIGSIPGEATQALLMQVVAERSFDPSVRRMALQFVLRNEEIFASKDFRKFILTQAEDPIALEAHKAFAAAGRK
jgi:HEAT repeats